MRTANIRPQEDKVAYAEKLVKSWRACWKRPDGRWDKLSGFGTKKAAEDYAEDQESAIRHHRWSDPRLGRQTVEDWANTWYAALDLELTTMDYYRSMLENHLLPTWGGRQLRSLIEAELEIAAWEKRLSDELSPTTARRARGVLSTLLSDAVPHILPRNPAVRRRARGKVAERRQATRSPEKVWITPLQLLYVGERASLLTGRDDEFIMLVTTAYTGLRWGELIGLEGSKAQGARARVDWQLYQLNDGSMIRKRPKDGSVRAIDLPPFLRTLLACQAKRMGRPAARNTCPCVYSRTLRETEKYDPDYVARYVTQYGHPEGVHLFRGPRKANSITTSGVPISRVATQAGVSTGTVSNVLNHPERVAETTQVRVEQAAAAVGFIPSPQSVTPPPMAAAHWSRSGFATWVFEPAATGFYPQKGHLRPRRPVPVDGGTPDPGMPVRGRNAHGRATSCWTPIELELTLHGLRHSHKTWMEEDGINDQLQDERLGHIDSSVQAVYSHVTDRMREHLNDSLSMRWNAALAEFAAARPTSPVGILNDLVTGHSPAQTHDHSRSTPDRSIRPLRTQGKRNS